MNQPPKILVVDDETIIALDIKARLTRLGFLTTGTARTSAEAFEAIERQRPDAVLMDIHIQGGMDGVEAAAIIRSRYHLPVIYLTAHADEATLERAKATEPFGYIVKPFHTDTINAVITMALRKHQFETEQEASKKLLSSALQQLEAAKRAADAANRAKSDFLARMSHEIRTPMNLINGMNTLLLESPLNEKQRQHVEISFRNVRRLLRLINGILDLSKVEAGELVFEEKPFDLKEVLDESAATIGTAVERKRLQLEVSLDLNVWPYWIGDAERLQQVLLNLIGNSIKFTDRGKIEVKVRRETGAKGEKGLRFEVTDTGCGIPRDKASSIFEAFHQVEGSMNRRFEGTGLGLAIAKTLVERMSGKIWLDDYAGPGSRFIFTVFLPASSEEAVRKKFAPTAAGKHKPVLEAGTRVLLVEDNPENVILMQAYLEGQQLSLDFASNGIEALEKRQRADYDLIVMDIQMPLMDGYQATRAIRRWEKEQGQPRVPVVALTAHALSGAATESLDAGCDGHLTKPVEREDLIDGIAKFAEPAHRRTMEVTSSLG